MAILNDPEDQNKQPTTGGTSSMGSGTGKGVGTAPSGQVQQNQAPVAGQAYTDVASYLNANQGGGQQLGEKVGSNLNKTYQDTQNNITNSVNMANTNINKGYTAENTDLIKQVAANPNQAAGNADTLSQFQGQLNDTYGGPTSWADYGTQQGNVQQAQQKANLLKTPGGNNVLVQEVENQMNPGQTSTGINTLDTLLFQGNQGAQNTAQAAAKPFDTLGDYLNSQNQGIQGNIAGAQTNAQNASQHALDAFTGANGTLTNLNNTVNTNASNAYNNAIARQQGLQQDLAGIYTQPVDTAQSSEGTYGGGSTPWYNHTNYTVNNTISPNDLAEMGITQDQWNALQSSMQRAGTTEVKTGHNFGAHVPTAQIGLANYMSQLDPSQINAATTANADQYNQYAAIQKLLGDKTPQDMALNPLNAAQAGTAPTSLTNFDYNTALGESNQFGDQARTAAQDLANQISGNADVSHAESQHGGGVFGSLKNAVMHPATLAATLANPLAVGANANRIMHGQTINPLDISAPGASVAAPIVGGVVGGIYGGPVGAMAGASAGQILGKPLQNLGGQVGKSYAHGGEVKEDDVNSYLDKKRGK